MNAVFCCPRCNTALGTPDNPRPEPLPPCSHCGWSRAAVPGRNWNLGLWLTAGMFALRGLGAGVFTAHSKVAVLFTLILCGPVATVGIARRFSEGWVPLTAAYTVGLAAGFVFLSDGETFTPGNLRFPLAAAAGSLLLGWLVGWLKHSE